MDTKRGKEGGNGRRKLLTARTRKAAALAMVVLLAAAAVGYILFKREDGKQRQAREVAFADLNQCLLDEIVVDDQRAARAMVWLQTRGIRLSDSERWPVGEIPWPQRCRTYASALLQAVDASTYWSEDARTAVRSPVFDLRDQLGEPGAERADLALHIEALWREAQRHELQPVERSSVKGPPRADLERSDEWLASLKLPFADFTPADEGPTWHFFAQLRDEREKIASCAPSEGGLRCSKYIADPALLEHRDLPRGANAGPLSPARLVPSGAWETSAYVQHAHSPRNRHFYSFFGMLHEGALEIRTAHADYVDGSGTAYWLDAEKLHIQPPGGETTMRDLVKVLKGGVKDLTAAAKTSVLIGAGLALTDGADARRRWFPVSRAGELGAPVDIPAGRACRAGGYYVFQGPSALSFVDAASMTTAASVPLAAEEIPIFHEGICSASGAIDTGTGLCRAELAECVRLPDGLYRSGIDTVGDRIFYASRADVGLVVHIGDPGFAANGEDVLVLPRAATGQVFIDHVEVFGDEQVALIVASLGHELIGLRLTSGGELGPIGIEWE